MNILFILIGCGVLKFEQWTANTFITGVFAEIAALVLLVVKYLFSPGTDKLIDLLKQAKSEEEGNAQQKVD